MFSHLYPESYTPFSSPHFSLSNATRIASLSFLLLVLTQSQMLSVQLISKFRPDLHRLKFCDRVCTQSKKLYEDRSGKMGAGKWCITFCVNMKKNTQKYLLTFAQTSVWKEVRHCSVQCILTETT